MHRSVRHGSRGSKDDRKAGMKKRLAINRWLVVWLAAAFATLRVIWAIVSRFIKPDAVPDEALLAADLTLNVAPSALIVVAIIAFVQYGRIYKARVPTE